jgi:hypothetical protein
MQHDAVVKNNTIYKLQYTNNSGTSMICTHMLRPHTFCPCITRMEYPYFFMSPYVLSLKCLLDRISKLTREKAFASFTT